MAGRAGPVHLAACRTERWPLLGDFRISRGAKSEATVVVAEVSDGVYRGRGECTPYARYGETPQSVVAAIEAVDGGFDRQCLLADLPAGAARNAIDCALWDLEAKRQGVRAWVLAGLGEVAACHTFYTLSLDTPAAMAAAARRHGHLRHLKLKLGGGEDATRMRAVRDARPDAVIVIDANEGWRPAQLDTLLAVARESDVALVEQPLPAGQDDALRTCDHSVPICADESAEPGRRLDDLVDRYDAVNIKLDKAGGLTHALALVRQAQRLGLAVFLGSMVATSLGIAPALMLAGAAEWVDLDSPLLLARDRPHALDVHDGLLSLPEPQLWG